MCDVLTELYKIPTSSTCNLRLKCVCRTRETSLDTLWNKNFKQNEISKQLLAFVRKNHRVLDEVREILSEFPRTPQEHIAELIKEFPSEEKFKKLQPLQVNYPADHFASASDIDNTIQQILVKMPRDKFKNVDYFDKLDNFITHELDRSQKNKKWIAVIQNRLCEVNNQTTKMILKKHFPKKKCGTRDDSKLQPYNRITHKVETLVAREFLTSKARKTDQQS